MKAKDIVENYLIGLGIGLKNSYTFIPKNDYEYSTKGKSETVELGNYKVKLTTVIRNTSNLYYALNDARRNFFNNVILNGDVGKACDKLMSSAVVYYAEFVKYIANNINIKAELADKLLVLADGAMLSTEKEINKVIAKYNDEMQNVRAESANRRVEMTAKAIAENNKVLGYHATIHKSEGIFGDSYSVSATPYRAGGLISPEANIEAANMAASSLDSIYEGIASDTALGYLKEARTTIIDSFNRQLKDLLVIKLDDYFDENYFSSIGKNLGDNPMIYTHYVEVIDSLKGEQFDDYKKALEYYSFDVTSDLKERVINNMYNAFIKDEKCDYDGIDYKLYTFLTGKKIGIGSEVAVKIKDYFSKLGFGHPKDNKELISTFDKKRELVKSCTYLSDDEKKQILNSYDSFEESNKKTIKNNVINLVLNILLVISGIAGIVTAGRYGFLFGDYNSGIRTMSYLGILVAIVVIFIVANLSKNLFKKILQGVLIIGFALLPITLNSTILKEETMREGKVKIQIRVLDEKKVVFLKEGEKVPLETITKDGYVFNGWMSSNYYINTPAYVNGEGLYIADLEENTGNLAVVTFRFNNGQKNKVIRVQKGVTPPTPEPPVKKGYKFVGWYDSYTKQVYTGRFNVQRDKVTVTAKWTKQ